MWWNKMKLSCLTREERKGKTMVRVTNESNSKRTRKQNPQGCQWVSRAPHDGEGMAVSVKVFPAIRAGGATHLALEAPQVFQPGLGATGEENSKL